MILKRVIFFSLLLSVASASEPLRTWVSRDANKGPNARLEFNAPEKKVYVTLLKGTKTTPRSVGVTFTNSAGKKTMIELKALDPLSFPVRYQGNMNQAESFVGFEIKIPLPSRKPLILKSHQMVEVK